ncbi:MAG: hypothetical protein KBT27_00170 [Prevotellaceae bacterium]|nr:hypothetical protein [Candidatus Faecinaster equi]
MSTKLRNIKILQPLFRLRDSFMEKTGLFHLKAKCKYTLFLRYLVISDYLKKKRIGEAIKKLPDGLLSHNFSNNDIVCSVTSYGKRVSDALPYMLYSLFIQTQLPKKVVVYLDNEHWNDKQLPTLLKKLQQVGVEFHYCEDLRSYKKLIPALRMFPDNPIITLDDDFYYYPQYIEHMTAAYEHSDKRTVLGQWGCIPEKRNGKYIPYNEWKDCKYGNEHSPISFFGCCCCYPPHIFDGEILKSDIFMKLCPTADDIWFWAMEERQHIKRAYIEPHGFGLNIYVNRIEEYDLSLQSTLMYINGALGKNNQQLQNVLQYYHLEDENND